MALAILLRDVHIHLWLLVDYYMICRWFVSLRCSAQSRQASRCLIGWKKQSHRLAVPTMPIGWWWGEGGVSTGKFWRRMVGRHNSITQTSRPRMFVIKGPMQWNVMLVEMQYKCFAELSLFTDHKNHKTRAILGGDFITTSDITSPNPQVEWPGGWIKSNFPVPRLGSRFQSFKTGWWGTSMRTVIQWVGGFAPSCRFAEAVGESANVGAAGPPGEVSSEVGEERILQGLMRMVLNLCLSAGTVGILQQYPQYLFWKGAPTSTSFWIAQFQAPVLTPSAARVGIFLYGKWAFTCKLRLPSSFQVHSIYFTSSHPKIKLERIICASSARRQI